MKKILKYLWFIFRKIKNKILLLPSYFDWIFPKYRIKKCATYDFRHLRELKSPFACKNSLQDYYDWFVKIIKKKLAKNEKYSVIRMGDGEALFLQGKYLGNIKKRHLTDKKTSDINLEDWKKEYKRNNLITYDLRWSLRKFFVPLEGKKIKKNYIPREIVYIIIANKAIFKIATNKKIGLIGSEKKLNVIKNLMEFSEYQDYLGIKAFHSYISIPETGACNDVEELTKKIISQAKKEKCDLYLVGIGISKLKVLSTIRDELDAIVIDVGCGIDALAGIIPKDREFFGKWTNYKIKDYDYNDIDFLSQNISDKHLKRFSTKKDIILGK